jgi:hypothetical protein
VVPLGFAGLVGAYFWFTREKKERKWADSIERSEIE